MHTGVEAIQKYKHILQIQPGSNEELAFKAHYPTLWDSALQKAKDIGVAITDVFVDASGINLYCEGGVVIPVDRIWDATHLTKDGSWSLNTLIVGGYYEHAFDLDAILNVSTCIASVHVVTLINNQNAIRVDFTHLARQNARTFAMLCGKVYAAVVKNLMERTIVLTNVLQYEYSSLYVYQTVVQEEHSQAMELFKWTMRDIAANNGSCYRTVKRGRRIYGLELEVTKEIYDHARRISA